MSHSEHVAVSLVGITKLYRGRAVLDDLSLQLGAGTVTGLVGPNGAGKSTLLGIVAGFCAPSAGRGEVLGQPIGPNCSPHPLVGLMPEKPAFVEHLSGSANLRLLAAVLGRVGRTGVSEALESVGLRADDRKPVRAYSQGMRQRLSLAQAIMDRPRLFLLDEPTNGLDPHGVVMLRTTVRRLAAEGATVVFASHLLSEVAAVSDRVTLIDGGRITRTLDRVPSSPEELEREYLSAVSEGAS
ncbi:MAG TPA: ATP-binding cassette domain-containing protein [Coriobacteriia bacterium]|nr:ATP-binding cassette domain-containing protein [Coriobacteriia bacterium]